ncbi:hypothetical protein D1007_30754 [Hordeum vulgare]|nr:hypothetical protein D1007_30754 [Hordeum vulgare]
MVTLSPEQDLPSGVVILADLIQAELAAYIGDFRDPDFAWEVTETAPLIFSVPFPSVELLCVCSHDLIRCPINKFMISIRAPVAEPDHVPPLEKVWVLVYGFPRGGRSAPQGSKLAHILKAISEPMGKLVTTDLVCFEYDSPTHIEIICPAPAEIDGMSLILYFRTKGKHLTFELDSPVPKDLLGRAPAATLPCLDDRKGGYGAHLGGAPLVRMMMMMLWFLRLHMIGGVAQFLLEVALHVLPGWLLGWCQGLILWPRPPLPLSQPRWLT